MNTTVQKLRNHRGSLPTPGLGNGTCQVFLIMG